MTEIPQNGPAARAVTAPAAAVRPTVAVRNAPAERAAKVEPVAKPDAPARSAAPAVPAATVAAPVVKEPPPSTGPTRTTAYSDASSGRYVIQVRETDSNEVINQYPPKELLRFYAAAREALERATARSAEPKDVSA